MVDGLVVAPLHDVEPAAPPRRSPRTRCVRSPSQTAICPRSWHRARRQDALRRCAEAAGDAHRHALTGIHCDDHFRPPPAPLAGSVRWNVTRATGFRHKSDMIRRAIWHDRSSVIAADPYATFGDTACRALLAFAPSCEMEPDIGSFGNSTGSHFAVDPPAIARRQRSDWGFVQADNRGHPAESFDNQRATC